MAQDIGEATGLSALKSVMAIEVEKWFDCGNLSFLQKTKEHYKSNEFDILDKESEAIWFFGNRVIKFSRSKEFIKDRLVRYELLPKKLVPKVLFSGKYTFTYEKVLGQTLSRALTSKNIINVLNLMKSELWIESFDKLDKKILFDFYHTKTYSRIDQYHTRYEFLDREIIVNGIKTYKFSDLLKKINWDEMIDMAISAGFHGDFHNENILVNGDDIKLLDWRQNFGDGNYMIGDVYYDLGKFMHGLLINHHIINKGLFDINWKSLNEVEIDVHSSLLLENAKKTYLTWLKDNNFSIKHVELHCALIVANIAIMHEEPYSEFLYLYAKLLLQSHLDNDF